MSERELGKYFGECGFSSQIEEIGMDFNEFEPGVDLIREQFICCDLQSSAQGPKRNTFNTLGHIRPF